MILVIHLILQYVKMIDCELEKKVVDLYKKQYIESVDYFNML